MVHVLLMMGGLGTRFGYSEPKQFLMLKGKPLYFYSLEVFENCMAVDDITIICCNDYIDKVREEIKNSSFKKVKAIIKGGITRQESVFNGLCSLSSNENDLVLIHDAARPLIDEEIVMSLIACARPNVGIAPYIKESDSLVKFAHDRHVNDLLIQTPQLFFFGDIYSAHKNLSKEIKYTDDLSLLASLGGREKYILGKNKYFKVTDPEDLILLKVFIS